jgi:hypothetical protein
MIPEGEIVWGHADLTAVPPDTIKKRNWLSTVMNSRVPDGNAGSRAHPAPIQWVGTGVLSREQNYPSMKLTPYLLLVPRLKMRGVVLSLPQTCA